MLIYAFLLRKRSFNRETCDWKEFGDILYSLLTHGLMNQCYVYWNPRCGFTHSDLPWRSNDSAICRLLYVSDNTSVTINWSRDRKRLYQSRVATVDSCHLPLWAGVRTHLTLWNHWYNHYTQPFARANDYAVTMRQAYPRTIIPHNYRSVQISSIADYQRFK